MEKQMKIQCPTCGRKGDWFSQPEGPFCSRRCKLVDLGKWFSEEHVVSQPLRPEDLEGELPEGEPPARQRGSGGESL